VSHDVIRDEYLANAGYDEWAVDAADDPSDEALFDLEKAGINITVKDAFAALLSAAAANMGRILFANVDADNKAGYLSGIFFSPLSCVNRLHAAVHSPTREYDLNTAYYVVAMSNTLHRFFKKSLDEARRFIKDPKSDTDEVVEIISTAVYGSYILRHTGRVFALEKWCEHHQEKSRAASDKGDVDETSSVDEAADDAESRLGHEASDDEQSVPMPPSSRVFGRETEEFDDSMSTASHSPSSGESVEGIVAGATPYFPTPATEHVESFTDFLVSTCTNVDGSIQPTMPQWTGQGDSAQLSKDYKNARAASSLHRKAAKSLYPISSKIAGLVLETDRKGRREEVVTLVRDFLSDLVSDELGCDLKPNQVSLSECVRVRTCVYAQTLYHVLHQR
jgi:hypothetical protein